MRLSRALGALLVTTVAATYGAECCIDIAAGHPIEWARNAGYAGVTFFGLAGFFVFQFVWALAE